MIFDWYFSYVANRKRSINIQNSGGYENLKNE
ncbi:MAG: hypothetical protein ACI9GM_000855 [Salibacteraceae bacterium]|jgi:hypothetical protein